MNTMKSFLGVALAAVMAFAPLKSHAEAANSAPKDGLRAGLHTSMQFMGVKVKRINMTATSALLVTGEGLLYGICANEGTLGKYSAAFDTAGQQIAGNIFTAANNAYKITPDVYTVTDTTSSQANKGCWFPPVPIKFATGLYGGQNDAGHQSFFLVGCSDSSNPCLL